MVAEPWIPVRYVHRDQICHLCFGTIPKQSPGARTGERGTVAWLLKGAVVIDVRGARLLGPDLWECIPCHDEQTRAELARYPLARSAAL